MKQIFNTKYPVDTLVFENEMILGSYNICNGIRVGEISILNIEDNKILHTKETSGTLNLKKQNNLIISANVLDIKLMNSGNLSVIAEHKTKYINTDLGTSENLVCCSTEDGKILTFDSFLNPNEFYQVSNQILWSICLRECEIYAGGDDKILYKIDPREKLPEKKLHSSDVITMINVQEDFLYLGSYDKNLKVYDLRNFEKIGEKDVKNVWKMKDIDGKICLACIYDGVKVFDRSWNLINHFYTDSMCYDVGIYNGKIAFPSFYDKKIHIYQI